MSAIPITVVRSENIAEVMQRVVFTGPGLDRIPADCAGLHIKLLFKKGDQAELTLPKQVNGKIHWPSPELKPAARTYSIFAYDAEHNELSVDFVLHAEPGYASDFARQAKPGDVCGFAGPGPARLVNAVLPRAAFVGDLSALPAIASVYHQLPENVSRHLWLALPESINRSELLKAYFGDHANRVHVFTPSVKEAPACLPALLATLNEWGSLDEWSVAVAGEHHAVVAIRQQLRTMGLPKDNLYAVPYWRDAQDEETYHAERHLVMDS